MNEMCTAVSATAIDNELNPQFWRMGKLQRKQKRDKTSASIERYLWYPERVDSHFCLCRCVPGLPRTYLAGSAYQFPRRVPSSLSGPFCERMCFLCPPQRCWLRMLRSKNIWLQKEDRFGFRSEFGYLFFLTQGTSLSLTSLRLREW